MRWACLRQRGTGDVWYAGGFALREDFTTEAPRNRNFVTWRENARVADGQTPLIVLDEDAADAGNAEFNIIAGTRTELDLPEQIGTGADKTTLTLNDLGGGSLIAKNSGVGIGVSVYDNDKYYVGLLSGTDLGAPVSNTAPNAVWVGLVRALNTNIGRTFITGDFALTVNFRDRTIATGDIPLATAGVHSIALTGSFDGHGVLTGTTNYKIDGTATAGYLSGLIGTNGAVGVFVASSDTDNAAGNYVGGFVAGPVTPTFYSWAHAARDSDGALLPVLATDGVQTATEVINLIRADADGIDINSQSINRISFKLNDTFNNAAGQTVQLNGDAASGVGFAVGDVTGETRYYVGLLSGTDLGAPLVTRAAVDGVAVTATWRGRVGLYHTGTYRNSNDFAITIDFTNRTLKTAEDYTITSDGLTVSLELAGYFDENGFITGTSLFENTDAGALTGVIGERGVVGAFYGTETDTASRYVGGFVATPSANITTASAYGGWVNTLANDNKLPSTQTPQQIALGNDATARNNILQGLTTALPTAQTVLAYGNTLSVDSAGKAKHISLTLNDRNLNDGFATFVTEFAFAGGTRDVFNSGILVTTNLGGIPTDTGIATWSARLAILTFTGENGDSFIAQHDFQIKVDFGQTQISLVSNNETANQIAFMSNGTSLTLSFAPAGWDANGVINTPIAVTGLISGTSNGTLTGIIGENGLTAVFKSSDDTSRGNRFSGGFVATFVPTSNYDAWINSLSTPPTAQTPSGTPDVFLFGLTATPDDSVLNNGVHRFAYAEGNDDRILGLNLASHSLGGDATDGFAAFAVLDGGSFAGILATTDLGGPRTESAGIAQWQGQLEFYALTGDIAVRKGFVLNVDFAAKSIATSQPVAFMIDSTDYTLVFNALWDATGALTNAAIDLNLNGVSQASGILTGIIGVDGAIGVFRTAGTVDDAYRFGGGFVAAPQRPATLQRPVGYFAWANSFDEFVSPAPTTGDYASILSELPAQPTGARYGNPAKSKFVSFNSLSEVGTTDDGFTIFTRQDVGIIARHAGILTTTRLGAPIVETVGNARWTGKLAAYVLTGATLIEEDFVLNVNYADAKISVGAVSASVEDGSIPFTVGTVDYTFTLSANWDRTTGVLTNGVASLGGAITQEGTLGGIIGVDGVVGVFSSTEGTGIAAANRFAGGFVATTNVHGVFLRWAQHAVEADSTTPLDVRADLSDNINAAEQIIAEAGEDEIDITATSGQTLLKRTLKLSDEFFNEFGDLVELRGDDKSGVALADLRQIIYVKQYAGLLPGTDVGAPIVDGTLNGRWIGRLVLFELRVETEHDFEMTVNFSDRSISNDSLKLPDNNLNFREFALAGNFDDFGLIRGTFNLITLNGVSVNTPHDGILTGLIGRDGAVGGIYLKCIRWYYGWVCCQTRPPHIHRLCKGFNAYNPYRVE